MSLSLCLFVSVFDSDDNDHCQTIQAPAIETALRERCGINVKEFAMIATLEDGHTATFTSEKLVAQEKYLFNQEFRAAYFRYTGNNTAFICLYFGSEVDTFYRIWRIPSPRL